MPAQAIIDGLYREVLFVAMILLCILLVNNLVLYKQKLRERLSLMLINAVVMCGFEIIWVFCEKHPNLRALTYIGACGYTISFVTLTAILNSYILERFDRLPKSKWFKALFYYVPIGAFALISVTSPLTHWLVEVDEAGVLKENFLFDGLFIPLMVLYVIVAVVVAADYSVKSRQKHRTATTRIAYNMIVFAVLIPAIYLLEALFLGIDSTYLALSLAVSVSMVYLTTNISTHTLMETNAKMAATESELNFATDIQTSVLPNIFPAFPERKEFDIHASMDAAKEVGGDFYDFFMIDDDHFGMVIADVSGKGVPAALFMMSSKILISDHATIGGTPAQILERVNKLVYANNKAHMFVTVWLGILEISTGRLTSASAGHEYPMINANGKYEILKDKHGLAIGAMPKSKYYDTEIMLKKGDSIFVYTDGVVEATDAENQLFGTERTLKALNSIPQGASQKEVLDGVRTAVDGFVKNAPQFDDLTMLGLKYNGPASQNEG